MRPFLLSAFVLSLIIAQPAQAADLHIKGNNQYGCIDKDYFNKTITLVAQDDREAFSKVLSAGLATGICTMFKAGEPVYLAKSGFLLIKVRRKGETAEYWTNTEAVK